LAAAYRKHVFTLRPGQDCSVRYYDAVRIEFLGVHELIRVVTADMVTDGDVTRRVSPEECTIGYYGAPISRN
jgi:hypothetical protein